MSQRRGARRPALTPLSLALAAACGAAQAQQQAGTEPLLPKVTVSSTRIEAPEDEVPATVTSKTAQEIERGQARDLKSLLADEPGISVRFQPSRMSAVFGATGRGGNEGINVRGLEGNQILLQVDGVRLPMMYESGPYVAGRGDYIDVEAFKRVELLRGPSSASYGSDGLAGAVSFLTKDPSDLLTLGKPWQGAVKLGYASADKSWVAVPSFALREGAWEAMLLASVRRGHEIDNRGDRDTGNWQSTVPNPQDRGSEYVLGKAIYKLDAANRFKLTLEHLDRRVDTDIRTVIGMPFVNANVTDAKAREDVTRTMGKLDWQYSDNANPWVQRFSAWVYGQDTENQQFGQERYNSPPAAWARRVRDTTYGERTLGLGFQGETNLGSEISHRLLWGMDYSSAKITSLKDGAHYDAAGNLITTGSASASTSLPNQSFPDSDYRLLGAFVQDEIAIGDWRITPALRVDRFEIDPEIGNPLYTRNNGVTPSKLSGDAVSPRIGVVWQALPLLQPYAQLARGFRSPTPWQINGGVSNTGANPPYRSIGNPDLKPERSTSFELGLRGREGPLRWGVAVYKSRYRDFIVGDTDVTATTTVPLDPGMAPNTRTFQSINAARAEIQGYELMAEYGFAPGWSVEARYAHAKGDRWDADGSKGALSTIEPDKGTLTLRYDRKGAFGGEFTLTGQKSQRRPHAPNLYIPKGYVVADIAGWWDITKQWQLNLAINNLADVKYANWADLRGLSATPANLAIVDAYTQPGRNVAISARYQF
ncbi:TonB-dependent hemoglobin/transferrin/lactoferrin family receptor [Piscinibacter sp.]|uniref:TonB-dependent hemoglobin/transferrin/lactoferrin family receptor n=1 Tax=Piscinibacter sp. TaxID=1903157 RepID=UPI0039E4DE08